jgi:hypothetical protein
MTKNLLLEEQYDFMYRVHIRIALENSLDYNAHNT